MVIQTYSGRLDLRYTILPGKNPPSESLELFDAAFRFWRDSWTNVYIENESSARPNPDDFFRQDFIPVIHENNKIAAIHLYSLFDLQSSAISEISYIKRNFTSEFLDGLRRLGVQKTMTMESLFVNPEYRKTRTGLSLVPTLAILGQRIFSSFVNADGIIIPARVDNGVYSVAQKIGFQEIPGVSRVNLHNTEVALAYAKKEHFCRPSELTTLHAVEQLWDQQHFIKNHLRAA